jgi:hypothetical protein
MHDPMTAPALHDDAYYFYERVSRVYGGAMEIFFAEKTKLREGDASYPFRN